MPKPSPRPFYRRKAFISLVVIGVLVLASLAAVGVWRYEHNKAIAADRARFEQAAADIQVVANAIKTTVPPESSSINKSCTYQGREWAPKPIVCEVTYEALYGANNLKSINDLVFKIGEVVKEDQKVFSYKGLGETPPNSSNPNMISFSQIPATNKVDALSQVYSDSASQMTCPLSYEIYNSSAPPVSGSYKASSSPLSVAVSLFCSANAKSVHYPITN